jgi:hypothetical protein
MSWSRAALVALGLAFAANGARDVAAAFSSPLGLQDDAYYYLMIARNLAQTGIATFDGVNVTNGYHPLWLWLETIVMALGGQGLDATGQVVAITALQYAVLGGGLLAVAVTAVRERRPGVAAALLLGTAVLLYPPHLRIFAAGMESTLVLPLGAAFLYDLWEGRPRWAGVFAALLVLARLDTMVYVVVPAVALSYRRPRDIAWALGPAAVVLGLYMLGNGLAFGHPTPISGMSKSSFPWPHFQPDQLTSVPRSGRSLRSLNQLTVIAVLVVGPLLVRGRGALGERGRTIVRWLAVLGALQLVSFVFFQRWAKPLEQWYLAPVVGIGAAIVAAIVVDLLGPRWSLRLATVFALLVAVLVGAGLGDRAPESQKQAVVGVLASTPPASVFASTDSGILAFGSGRRVINLDGLVNSFAYQDAIRDRHLGAWLRNQGAKFLIVRIWETAPAFDEPMYRSRVSSDVYWGKYSTYDFWVHSYVYDADSEPIPLGHGRERWRGPEVMDQGVRSRFVIFVL